MPGVFVFLDGQRRRKHFKGSHSGRNALCVVSILALCVSATRVTAHKKKRKRERRKKLKNRRGFAFEGASNAWVNCIFFFGALALRYS